MIGIGRFAAPVAVSLALLLVGSAAPAPGSVSAPTPSAPASASADAAPSDSAAGDEALPPGHPGMPGSDQPQDRVSPAPELPPGVVEVFLRDAESRPVGSTRVKLGILRQDVATGDSHEDRGAVTDGAGVARFEGLPRSSEYSYRVMTDRDAATYASESFHLDETAGRRALLHVYPVTRDLRQALVGMRGVLFVQPREDVFQFEANFQVLNVGKVTWVPADVRIVLPEGAKAFRASDSTSDTRAERAPSGDLMLLGTYSPGEHDVGFTFQVDNHHDPSRSFKVDLPPHVAELRVVAEAGKETTLRVDGFPDPDPMQGQDGSRLLVTGKQLARGEPALDSVAIDLDGLPVPSPGRWYAVAIAVALFLGGLVWSRRSPEEANQPPRATNLGEAIDLIVGELVALERLNQERRIGPRTYAETRTELIDALGRLGFRREKTRALSK